MVTITHDHAARRRSYELIAEAFGLDAARSGRGACGLSTAPRSSTGWPARRAATPSPPPARRPPPAMPVVALGTAGHVLDFDDPYLPGSRT